MPESNDYDPPRNRSRRDRDEDDDRPRRRRDEDDDDFDDRPRRRRGEGKSSSGVMIVAIIAGVLLLGCVVVGALVGLLLPAVQKVREAAARMNDQNNLRQLSMGMMTYESANATLPPAQEKVSWRVYILPYIEQGSLARQFKMDEPWDSASNKQYASTNIKTLVSASDPAGTTETRYRVFVGPGTLYAPGKPPLRLREVKDSAAGTILIAEAGDTVPWPQPRELDYERGSPLPALGIPSRKGFNVAMLDGSVKFASDKTSPDMIRGGIEPNDGKFFEP